MTATTDSVPEIDVWAWTQETDLSLDKALDTKKAVLSHPSLGAALNTHIGEIEDESADARTAGIARWMLAQYHRAYPLLDEVKSPDPLVLFAKAECALKGQVKTGDRRGMRRPDLAAEQFSTHPWYKSDPRVFGLWLDALLFDHDMAAVQKGLDDAPAAFKETASCAYVEGRLSEAEGDYRSARTHYLKALERDPGHRGALLRLAFQHDLGGDDEEALDYYRRLAGMRPLDLHASLNYGVMLEDRGENDEAFQLYRRLAAAFPTHSRVQNYLRDAQGSLNMKFDEDSERRHDKRNQILRIPISDFELSVRARNCLSKMSIETLGDLVQKSESELLSYKNFGETSLNEIKILLESKGLRLGMNLNEDPIPVAPPAGQPQRPRQPVELPPGVDPSTLSRVLADLDLSVRCRKALAQLKAVTIGDLLMHTEAEMLSIKNFGQTSLNELKARLSEFGLSIRSS